MIAAIRDACDMAIDLHTENPKSTGGFIRHYEVPEFIKVAAPVYLKTGGSVAANHNWDTTEKEAISRIKQVLLVKRMINTYCPDAVVSPKQSDDLSVPE
jgi:predicted deacylase